MSRVGRLPIAIPEGVEVEGAERQVTVAGPKGTLTRALPRGIAIETGDGQVVVKRASDAREHRALHGLTRTLIANMVEGVSRGFSRTLELYGVGYRAIQAADKVTLQLGFAHPVEVQPPEGIRISLESFTPTLENQYLSSRITVEGIDKEQVGQFAAKIRAARKPEPYKGKGLRYLGERVRRKPGKTAKAAGTK
jgi:large subunit ribosomal protein L6